MQFGSPPPVSQEYMAKGVRFTYICRCDLPKLYVFIILYLLVISCKELKQLSHRDDTAVSGVENVLFF